MTNNLKEINDVQKIIDEILSLIDEAETKFNKARNWGFFDILGGGFITDLFKHSNLDSASDIMNKINYLLKDLQRELDEVVTPTDFSMNTQSCPTLCDPMNHSTPGLPVHHQLQEFTQTHVHQVSDAIQPSHPLSSPFPPAPNTSQHQSLFQ